MNFGSWLSRTKILFLSNTGTKSFHSHCRADVDGPGGPGNLEPSVSFAGEGAGSLGGELSSAGATVAGRWTGSGHRHGRIVFALNAAEPGVYTVPVRFVLSAP